MIIHDLSPEAVTQMTQVDLSQVTERPGSPIGEFAFHDCRIGVGSFVGCPHWERHNGGDELLFVLAGRSNLTVVDEAFDRIDVGGLIVNDVSTYRIDHMPYGGVKSSGTGREGPRYAIEEMTELKLIVMGRSPTG